MDLLSTCVIIILIKFGMQPSLLRILWAISLQIFWHRKVPLPHFARARCISGTFLCQVVKHVSDNETYFSVLDRLHLFSYSSRQKHQFPVHSKLLSCSVSKRGKMWHGKSLMGGQHHIQHSTENLLLLSVRSCYRFWPPKDYQLVPETLLPKRWFTEVL